MSVASLFPPGTDLCQIAMASPQEGQVSNLDDPPLLRTEMITLTVVLTSLTTIFVSGRLHANIKKLSWSDGEPPGLFPSNVLDARWRGTEGEGHGNR